LLAVGLGGGWLASWGVGWAGLAGWVFGCWLGYCGIALGGALVVKVVRWAGWVGGLVGLVGQLVEGACWRCC